MAYSIFRSIKNLEFLSFPCGFQGVLVDSSVFSCLLERYLAPRKFRCVIRSSEKAYAFLFFLLTLCLSIVVERMTIILVDEFV